MPIAEALMVRKVIDFVSSKLVISSILAIAFSFGFLLQHIGLIIPHKYLNAPQNAWDMIDGMRGWLSASYFEHGLKRRMLVGTLLHPFSEQSKYSIFLIVNACSILFCFVFFVRFTDAQQKGIGNVVVLIFALSSLGSMQMGWTFGRFDQINFSLLIMACIAASRNRVLLTALLLSLATLVHEASIFYCWPLPLAIFYERLKERGGVAVGIELTKILALPVFLTTCLFFFGNSTVNALGATRGVIEIPYLTFKVGAVCALYVVCIFVLVSSLSSRRWNAIQFSPYLCLPLFIMGVDYGRWLGIMFFVSVTVILLELELHGPKFRKKLSIGAKSSIIFLSLPFLGPIGVEDAFPAIKNFFELVAKVR